MWKVLDPSHPATSVLSRFSSWTLCVVSGSSLMKVTVKKDGHHFCTHINQAAGGPASPRQPDKDFQGKDGDVRGVLAESLMT